MKKVIILSLASVFFFSCKHKEKKTEIKIMSTEKNEPGISRSGGDKQSGEVIYNQACAKCHMPKGQGIPNVYPPLAKSNWLTEKRSHSIHNVKYGIQGPIEVNGKPYQNVMTPPGLTDQQVVEVMNYVMTSFGNKQTKKVTLKEVQAVKEDDFK